MKTILIIGILALLLSACVQVEQPVEKFKIGVISPMTGSQAVYGGWTQKGGSLALENLDNVELIYEDSKCDPKEGLSAFNKLADADDVKAIVSTDCSSPAVAYATAGNERGILVLVSGSVVPAIADIGDYVFRVRYTAEDDAATIMKLAAENSWKKPAIIYQETDGGISYLKELEKRMPVSFVAKESYVLTSTDYRTELTKIKNANPDVLLVFTQGDLGSTMLRQIKEVGITVPLVSSGTNFPPKIVEASGDAAEGLYATFAMFDTGGYDKGDEFKNSYKSKFGEEPNYFIATTYDAINIVANAAKECGNDIGCMRQSIAQIKNYSGLSSTITFDERGELVGTKMGIKQVKDGKFMIV